MLEIWLGKLALTALRAQRRGATTLPGRLARRLSPYVLLHLAADVPQRVMVTGTNGKTTTCRLVADTCRKAGLRLVHNRSGANLAAGVTTAFLAAADWGGRVHADAALLEVDEASAPRLAPEVRPQILAATNFFRDQLDRYGEIDRTVAQVEQAARAMGPGRTLLLNADDPLSVALAERLGGAEFFGVEVPGRAADSVVDVHRCPRCGEVLTYRHRTIGHLGAFSCPGCRLARPAPQATVLAAVPREAGQELVLRVGSQEERLTTPLPGLYNAYNIALAGLLAHHLGVLQHFPEAVAGFRTSFGRMEAITVQGRTVTLALVKNPVGFNAALSAFLERPGAKSALFLINDRDADGHDVSWLWDVDFERLLDAREVTRLFTGGLRGPDMAVRLKYAGVGDRLVPGEGLEEPWTAALQQARGELFVFATYTALLELRARLAQRGEVAAFWQE